MKLSLNSTQQSNVLTVKVVEEEWSRAYNGEIRITFGPDVVIHLSAEEAHSFAESLQSAYFVNLGKVAAEQEMAKKALAEKRAAEKQAAEAAATVESEG